MKHDVRWLEDDWESPTLGASGVGWEVRFDGMEVTQFTYFQQMAGFELKPITAEITYGLERLAMFSQKKRNVFELAWDDRVSYGDIHSEQEAQFSHYHFEESDPAMLRGHFADFENECLRLAGKGYYLPAYDDVMRCSHIFNLLDARGAVSVTERTALIAKVRGLAKACAKEYVKKVDGRREMVDGKENCGESRKV